MAKDNIWRLLKNKGFSDVAAAAIMGNMEAESNCVSSRLQSDFTDGYTRSAEYTAQVDRGIISRDDFIYHGPGGGGYGLLQWTFWSRKAGLFDLAEEHGVSIADEALQVDWLLRELWQEEFKKVINVLNTSDSIRECSDVLVKSFLRPANQSESVLAYRAGLGRELYEEYADLETDDTDGFEDEDEEEEEELCDGDIIEVDADTYKVLEKCAMIMLELKDVIRMLEELPL